MSNIQFLLNNATITASGSATFTPDGDQLVLFWNIQGPITGSFPTIQFSVTEVDPFDLVTAIGQTIYSPVINAAVIDQLQLTLRRSPVVLVQWIVAGGTPSFGMVNLSIASGAAGVISIGSSGGSGSNGFVDQNSATAGETGPLVQGAVTTSAPTYTTAKTNPLSLTTAGALRTDSSATTQPVSGTVTANAGSGTFTVSGTVSQGSANTAANSWPVEITDGTNTLGVSAHPVRVDPTGTTTQPVSGTVTANAGSGTFTVSGTVTSNIGTTNGLALDTSVNGILISQGSTTSGEKGPLIQGAVTTAAPTYTTAQTSPLSLTTTGALRTDSSATTQPVSGTVTANAGSGTFTVGGTVTSNIGTTNGLALDATLTGGTQTTKITDGTNTATVKAASTAAIATDKALVVAISPNNSITTTNSSVGTNGSAIPSSSTQIGGSDGTNLQVPRVFDADTGAGTQYVLGVGLRKSASGGSVDFGTSSDPIRIDPTGTTTQPISGTVTANAGSGTFTVSGTITANQGGTWTVQPGNTANTTPWLATINQGGNSATVTGSNALKVDGSAVTQPVSGTITANIGTSGSLALDTSVNGVLVSQGSTTSGEKGPLIQGAVTTAAPSYTTAQTSPLSLTTAGLLRTDGSGVTQPVSGTITANAGSGTFTVSGTVTSNIGTTNGLALDTSVTGLQVSQGSTTSGQKGGLTLGAVTTAAPSYTTAQSSPLSLTTAGNLRVDGSSVTQPVSGTITANAGSGTFTVGGSVTANIGTSGSLALDTSVNGIIVSQGSTTSGEKGPLIQGAVTTAAPSYTTAQTSPLSLTTGGALRTDSSATTQPVSGTVTANQGGTWTVQPGNTANTTPWLATINQGGNSATVTASNALKVDGSAVTQPVSGTTTANQGTANSLANAWSAKITDTTNGPVAVKAASTAAVAADQALVVAVSPNNSITVNSGTQKSNIDAGNSSTTLLGSNGVFTGTSIDVSGYSSIHVTMFSDKAGSVQIQFSNDGSNWDISQTYAVAANIGSDIHTGPQGRFFRLVYTNGASAQTVFRLQTFEAPLISAPTMVQISTTVDPNADALLTKSSIVGKNSGGGGTFVDVKVSPSGALTVDGSGVTQPISGTITANQGGAPWSENITQFGGVNISTGTGASGTGIPRVTVANDSNILATQSGTWNVGLNAGGNTIGTVNLGTTTSDRTNISQSLNMTSTTNAVTLTAPGTGTAAVQITGATWTGTIAFEATVDGSNWFAINAIAPTTGLLTTSVTGTTQNSQWLVPCAGYAQIRVRCSIVGTNSATVSIEASSGTQALSSSGLMSFAPNITSQILIVSFGSSTSILLSGHSTVTVILTSLGSGGVIAFEATSDGANFVPVNAIVPSTGALVTSTSSTGTWQIDVAGFTAFRCRETAVFSGTITGSMSAGYGIGTTLLASSLPTGSNTIGAVTGSGNFTVAQATAANLNATVTGTVTSNQGTANTLANKWPVQITDGTNTMPVGDVAARASFNQLTDGTNTQAVKAASTAPAVTDPASVVAISPNSIAAADRSIVTAGTKQAALIAGLDGTTVARIARVGEYGTQRTTSEILLWHDALEGSTVNTFWTQSVTTQTIAQATGVLTLNNSNITTVNTDAIITSIRQFPKYPRNPLYCRFRANITANVAANHSLVEMGFGAPAGVTAVINNGAFFRWRVDGTLAAVVSYNGTEKVTQVLAQGTINTSNYYYYDVIFDDDFARFIVADASGTPVVDTQVSLTLTFPVPIAVSHIPTFARTYVDATGGGTAIKLNIAAHTVQMLDGQMPKPWEHQLSSCMRHSSINPTSYASTPNLVNAAAPGTATPSNTTSAYTTLGGEYAAAATAASESILSVFGFTVPSPYTFYLRSLYIPLPVVQGASVVTVPLLQWFIAPNASSTNLSTATGLQRITLPGLMNLGATLTVGTIFLGSNINWTPQVPIACLPGTVLHIGYKSITGAATASVVYRGTVYVDGFFE